MAAHASGSLLDGAETRQHRPGRRDRLRRHAAGAGGRQRHHQPRAGGVGVDAAPGLRARHAGPDADPPQAEEAAPREGFFEPATYFAVRRRLPEDLQVAVTIAYTYGWRMRSDVLALARRQVDLDAGTLRLDPGCTKNDDGRVEVCLPHPRAKSPAGGPRRARQGP